MPEKLLSIKETAEYLEISEEEVKRLVDLGEIPAYKIGGTFLRFRKEQIDAIKKEISNLEEEKSLAHERVSFDARTPPPRDYYDYTFMERVKDFFYFYDFYILSFIVIFFLLYLIFKT